MKSRTVFRRLIDFKWALKNRDNFKNLIVELKSYSESLYRLCPENAFESKNIYLTMECLAGQESPAGLKWTSKLAAQQAEVDGGSSVRQGYELLASAATLKALVNENRSVEQADDNILTSISEEQRKMRYLGKGLALFERGVVYVEMRDYRRPQLDFTPDQKAKLKRRRTRARFSYPGSRHYDMGRMYGYSSGDETEEDMKQIEPIRPTDPKLRALIKNFYNTFQGANTSKSVYALDIAGIIDHTDGEHKGYCSILYKLPGIIGVQSRERPAENLKLRAPMTLKSLLGNRQGQGI